jgi:ATP/maltotriose-dependent transcriptional regulator MalT
LINAQAKGLLGRGEIATLIRWIELLPESAISRRPQLGLATVWAMLMRDPLKLMETIDQKIQQLAEGFGIVPGNLLGALAETDPDSERQSGLGEFAMLQAYLQGDRQSATYSIQLFKAALEYLPEREQLLRGFTLAGLASTYVKTGAVHLVEQAFNQAAQISKAINSL